MAGRQAGEARTQRTSHMVHDKDWYSCVDPRPLAWPLAYPLPACQGGGLMATLGILPSGTPGFSLLDLWLAFPRWTNWIQLVQIACGAYLAVSTPSMKSLLASLRGLSSGERSHAGRPRRRSAFSKEFPLLCLGPAPLSFSPFASGSWSLPRACAPILGGPRRGASRAPWRPSVGLRTSAIHAET